MTPREKPTEPREAPKENTLHLLRLFVYGTLESRLPAIDRLEGFRPGGRSL